MIGPISSNTSLNIVNNLNRRGNRGNKIMSQLSSGKRINSFAVDPAGGAIAEKMQAQYRGYEQEINNIEDKINMLNTKEGGYNAITESLQRIRELQIQARNDTLTDEERQAIQQEINMNIEDIKRFTDETEYNTKKLITPGDKLKDLMENGVDATGDLVDDVLKEVTEERSSIGAETNSLRKQVDEKMIAYENTVASYSTVADMDMAKGLMEKANNDIMEQANIYTLKSMFNLQKDSVSKLLG